MIEPGANPQFNLLTSASAKLKSLLRDYRNEKPQDLSTSHQQSSCYAATFAFIFMAAANVQVNDVPILQPGLPGEGARLLTAEEAVKITDTSYSPDDVAFMQGMISPSNNKLLRWRYWLPNEPTDQN